DMTGLGTQRDLTKSTADGMYYFVLGQNDVQATDWVIGKIENNALTGNTRIPAETKSIMGLDIWGTLTRSLSHSYKEPPPVIIPVHEAPQQAQEDVNRALADVMNGIGQSESMQGVWSSAADVQIQDETFSVPGVEWLEAQNIEMELQDQPLISYYKNLSTDTLDEDPSSISFYENLEPGREPIPVYSPKQVVKGTTLGEPGAVKSEMLLIAAEVLQSAGDDKSTVSGSRTEGRSSTSYNESPSETNKQVVESESLTNEEQVAGDNLSAQGTTTASEEEVAGGEGAESEVASENDISAAAEESTSGEKDAAKPSVQAKSKSADFLSSEVSKKFLTDVRVVEGEVYVIDGANEMSLLGRGESLRVNFKEHTTFVKIRGTTPAEAKPLTVVKADPPSALAVKDDPVKPIVKDDMSASSVRDDALAVTVDMPKMAVKDDSSAATAVKKVSHEMTIPPAPEQVAERIMPSVIELAKTGTRYGTLQNAGKDVFVKCQGGEWQAAKDGMVILPGDQVRTASQSSVEVLLDNGKVGVVEVKGGSLFRISKAETDPVMGDKTTLLDLAVGKVMVHVEKLKGNSRFEVKTPTALTGVRGTTFEVTVKEKI
ncbi:MAG: FecR family protein, partial [Candidatus Omnitrophica bacterium]|nr:FecR family protein [Candidatus Omnitrophota bacterium]